MNEAHAIFVLTTICGALCAAASAVQSVRWWKRFGKADVVPLHWGVDDWGSWVPARIALVVYPLVVIAFAVVGPFLGSALDHVRHQGLPPPSWVHGVSSTALAEEMVSGTFAGGAIVVLWVQCAAFRAGRKEQADR